MLNLKDGMLIFNVLIFGYNTNKEIEIPRFRKEFNDIVSKDFIGNEF